MRGLWKSEAEQVTKKLGHTVTASQNEVGVESLGSLCFSTFPFEGEGVKLAFVKNFFVWGIL